MSGLNLLNELIFGAKIAVDSDINFFSPPSAYFNLSEKGGERYSASLLNGAQIPSPDLTRNVVPLNVFPTSVISSLKIYKSWSKKSEKITEQIDNILFYDD